LKFLGSSKFIPSVQPLFFLPYEEKEEGYEARFKKLYPERFLRSLMNSNALKASKFI
jgi:hypothetical protein